MNSPTGNKKATNKPPKGDSVMSIETRANNSGNENIFVSSERLDFIQITNVGFY